MYNVNMLVFADELGRMHEIALGDTDMQCRDKHHSLQYDYVTRGQRTSVIVAISCAGLIGYDEFTGNI